MDRGWFGLPRLFPKGSKIPQYLADDFRHKAKSRAGRRRRRREARALWLKRRGYRGKRNGR